MLWKRRDASPAAAVGAAEEALLREAFIRQVELIPGGEKIRKCIQCGTCTGSCPVSYAMDLSPRQVMALFRAGDIEAILESRTIWVCASCYACTVRCPSGIKITDVLYALKRMAMEQQVYPRRFPTHILADSFAALVDRYGRNWEPGLLMLYYFKSGRPFKLLANAPLAFRLWRKGRLQIAPDKLKSADQLRKIIEVAGKATVPVVEEPRHYSKAMIGYKAIA